MIKNKIAGNKFQELIEILEKLRSQEGCPWDQKQTSKSLIPYLLEETYEVIEAIEEGEIGNLKEELGDLTLHILFQAQIAKENHQFDITDSLKNIINKLIENILSDKRFFNRILLDGYPRNITQAKKLDFLINKYNQKISCVFSLDVDKETIIKRILGRQTCTKCGMIFNEFFKPSTKENHLCDNIFLQKRSDDNEKTIINRYETYINKTVPILNFYQDQNMLYRVNGIVEIDQIYKEICDIISSLEA